MTTCRQQLRSEGGWVMVPVIVLMVAAMGVAFALLAVVDTQTGQSREQRSRDASQTLAEGVVSSTASILADSASAPVWRVTACERVSGDLTHASTAPSTSFAARVTEDLQDRFSDQPEYAESGSRTTTWRVDVCPVAASDSRWQDTFLTRGTVTPGTGAGKLWVRAQTSARTVTGAARAQNTRAIVSKVKQDATPFRPPAGYAVGTGAFSTDVGTALNNTTSALLGGALTKPLIASQSNKIGVRCGLLSTINNLSTTCVTGALAGVGGTTNALGLGFLNGVLGIDRAQALGTWSMAPTDAVEAWRNEAKQSGIYVADTPGVPGYGSVLTSASNRLAGGPRDCISGSLNNASTVVFIEKVGNGEQYCDVRANTTAKILVIARGGVRVSAQFTGVVYALNLQECGSDGTCTAAERTAAVPREVVRLEGNTGKVVGSVWADGAGGQVGIYPSLNLTGTGSNSSLLSIGNPSTGICGLPVVGPLLNGLGATLSGLLGVVGNVLSLVAGVQEEVRYPAGTPSNPTGCDFLRGKLGGLTSSQLVNVFGTGGDQTIVLTERRTRTCKTWLVVCLAWNPWSDWSTRDTQTVSVPALLNSGTPSLIEQVAGILGSTLSGYTAIQYDETVVSNAGTNISQGAAPVVGTYRNLQPAA